VKHRDGKSSVIKGKAKVVDVYVDGHDMGGSVSLPRDTHGEVTGVSISKNEVRPFVFADIRTTGADYPLVPNCSVMFTLCPWIIQMKTQPLAIPARSPTR